MRRFMKLMNRFFMVPLYRLGFGPVFGNPLSGYMMVVRTIGRKTGRIRYTPVNYAIANGCVYCVAGYGRTSDWYLNMMAAPDVSLILPSGGMAGHVEEVEDDAERVTMIRAVFRNAGFMGFGMGFNPYRSSDDQIRAKTAKLPVLRIRPAGLASGPSDPGGWAWVLGPLLTVALIALVVAIIR